MDTCTRHSATLHRSSYHYIHATTTHARASSSTNDSRAIRGTRSFQARTSLSWTYSSQAVPLRIINVYNEPSPRTAYNPQSPILALEPHLEGSGPVVLLGDFNLHHFQWSPPGTQPFHYNV